MALQPTDQPQDLPCGVVDQDWLDQLNDWRLRSFNEIIANTTSISSLSATLQSHIAQLPEQIRNNISPRFFTGTDKGSGALTVKLPDGGTWHTHVVYRGGSDQPNLDSSNSAFVYFVDDDNNTVGGSIAEQRPGGYTYTVSQGASVNGIMSVFAYRI